MRLSNKPLHPTSAASIRRAALAGERRCWADRSMRALITAALLLGASLGASAGDSFSDLAKASPACEKGIPREPVSGKQFQLGPLALSVPACFERAKEERRYIHGGKKWECDGATLEVTWGMWGESSFGPDRRFWFLAVRTPIGVRSLLGTTCADRISQSSRYPVQGRMTRPCCRRSCSR
jgi:hypothetical protein